MKVTKLFVDQYGQKFYAKTVKELKEQLPGRIRKMYVDGKNGGVFHVGYRDSHYLTKRKRG